MQQLSTPSVWIVDDDEDDQLFIRSAFLNSQPPISVLSLSDGEDLLPTLDNYEQTPRLILLDINMPRKNGFEALSELRSVTKYAALPVVMLTTSSSDQDRQQSLVLGANEFLTKPLTFQQLNQIAQSLREQWLLR
ncbi:response regulator [Spirosoma pollinicola]|uniref:Response regulator n=1 Tax=Spirosoma pollinicola TaxID=2057025 RepID=A0A2K8ZAX5_9BACT|nr:response regulator [Spirosoma pollinicola]AUD07041.1 response regulator [Spirosoma pollinicola]